MIAHPLPEEHPWLLEDIPSDVGAAWSADCLPPHTGDLFAVTDGLVLVDAIPVQRASETVICPSCGCPISPTGECRCSD